MDETNHTNTIIIGASAAGLACAACLKKYKIPFILLEQYDKVGMEWLCRYDRLHLHTSKKHSHLPSLKMPGKYDRYVSKDDFANYLQHYSDEFNIQPFFNKKVVKIVRKEDVWEVSTASEKFTSRNVIIATGFSRKPLLPEVQGIEDFKGEAIHSSQYKNGKGYIGKKVLVVGFGNSACEIAIDLHEYNAVPSLSVRNAVNIIPRDLAGIPILNIVIAESWLTKISPRLTDTINKPILHLIYGNYKKYGLKKLPYGPITQVIKHKRIPLLDIGTMNLIKNGKIKVYPDIERITANCLKFTDGRVETFDAMIFATGYEPAVSEFLKGYDKFTDEPAIGLYFCGFNCSPNGMIREIGIDAKRIAKAIMNFRVRRSFSEGG